MNRNIIKNKKGIGAILVVIIVLAIVAVAVISFIAINNSLIAKQVAVDQAWSQVRNVYQRQADLIPNLANSVKGYMQFEAGVLTNVTNARTAWLASASQNEVAQDQAGVQLTTAVHIATGALLSTVEAYPVLKSDALMMTLLDELAGSQNRISTERGRYIETIGDYNTAVRTFPGSMFGFPTRQFYQGSEGIDNPPVVTFP
jgi:LemA protein